MAPITPFELAEALARQIADNAPLTITAVKFVTGETQKDQSAHDLARCDAMVTACFDSADYIEGRHAFMEKRKPVWQGR